MDAEHKRVSDRAVAEYLKHIFKLEEREGHRESPVQTTELAQALGLTAPAVTEMAKKLSERGMVDYTPYRGLRLTAHGRREATRALRRHRIVERFLTDMLGFPWSDAHELAVQFEHELPERVEERLYAALHKPADCPHGFPIPVVPEDSFPEVVSLYRLEAGETSEVATVLEEGPDIVEFIDSLGLRPGAEVKVLQKAPFDGPLVVRVDGVERTIGHRLSEIVTVRPPRGAPPMTAERQRREVSQSGVAGIDRNAGGD